MSSGHSLHDCRRRFTQQSSRIYSVYRARWRHRVMMRLAFCGYNTIQCVELNGEDLSCYSNKIESISLIKCPRDQWLTNETYLSAITVTNIYQSFTYKMTAKINWHRYGTKLRHCHPMCIQLLLSLFAGRSNHVESREPRLIHRWLQYGDSRSMYIPTP